MMNETLNEILHKHNVTALEIAEALYVWIAMTDEEPELVAELADLIRKHSL